MSTLVFAFKGTVAEHVAKQLTYETVSLDSSVQAIEQFVKSTDLAKYDYVLGMGMYSGRDYDAIRIETKCSNKFRSNKSTLDVRSIPYFLKPSDEMKLANGIGNSWCNLVSYKLISLYPGIRYTFLHIPKTVDDRKAALIIDQQLSITLLRRGPSPTQYQDMLDVDL